MFYTYILYSQQLNKSYIGSCDNIEKRLHRHNKGHTKFTKTGLPWTLVYAEQFQTRADAFKREQKIKKKKSKAYIEKLIFSSKVHPDSR